MTSAANSHEGVHGWWLSCASVCDDLAKAGVTSDKSYLQLRLGLGADVRQQADLWRLATVINSYRNSATTIARACPPEFQAVNFDDVDLPVRVRNCLASRGVHTIADLGTLTDKDLLRIQTFGKKSLLDLAHALTKAAESHIGLQRGLIAKAVTSVAMAERNEPKVEVPDVGLDGALKDLVDRVLAELPKRGRAIIEGRFGISGVTRTLQQIADDFGITRERVRQIERRAIQVLRRNGLGVYTERRLADLLKEREEPLYLEVLPGEDSWFKGYEACPVFFASLLRALSNGAVSVFDVNGMNVISKASQENFELARRETLHAIERSVLHRPTRLEVEVTTEAIARYYKCPELYKVVLKGVTKSCLFVLDSGARTEYLVGFGKSAETLVKAVLEGSDCPLHFRDIHERAEALAGRSLYLRNIHNAAIGTALLLGRGTYGLWKHVSIAPTEAKEILEFVENLVMNSGPEKQWHCSDLIEEIAKEGIDAPEELDYYALSALLKRSGRLTYLKRQVWASSKSPARTTQDRVDVQQAVVAILRQAGIPMTSDELQQAVEKHRGVGQFFQIHPEGDLVRVGVALWGLFGRDVPITQRRAREVLDYLASHLQTIGHALTGAETVATVDRAGFQDAQLVKEATWMSLAAQDKRFRVWSGPLLSLSSWESPRRVSKVDAVMEVLSEAMVPMTATEIAPLASKKAGYSISVNSVLAALRKCGARHSFSQGGWTSPADADDLAESNEE